MVAGSRLFATVFTFLAFVSCLRAEASTLEAARAADERHDYREAATLYDQLLGATSLPEGVSRDELRFRRADAQWRALAATRQSDPQVFAVPREVLVELGKELKDAAAGGRPLRLWAEVQASLGDSWWLPAQFRDWHRAWPHYQQALQWWAGSTELERAREQYLALVFRAARPAGVRPNWRYGNSGNWMPEDVLHNAVKIAERPADRARAHYLLAVTLARQYGANGLKAGEQFQAALAEPGDTDWRDDALFQYAQWAGQLGGSDWDEHGNFVARPDYPLAVTLYQEFLDAYAKGDSRYWDQAKRQLENITEKRLDVFVANNFRPGSAVEFSLSWRNLSRVDVGIYAIDLAKDFDPKDTGAPDAPRFSLEGRTPVTRLSREADGQPYMPQQDSVRLDEGLPPGAYVVAAQAGGETAQALLLVTDHAMVALRDSRSVLAWVTQAETGAPVEGAEVVVWAQHQWWDQGTRFQDWIHAAGPTPADGLARFAPGDFTRPEHGVWNDYSNLWLLASVDGQPVVAQLNGHYGLRGNDAEWRVYGFTDRPAYRPGDTVHWKAIARARQGAESWRVAPGEPLYLRVVGPRGEEVFAATQTPNDFGSVWGQLEPQENWALGLYRVEFRRGGPNGEWIGQADFFRLEEYKLPEFKVAVEPAPPADGEAGGYRLGDDIPVEVVADYYFGGAVTNASVEVVVRKSPFYHYWRPPSPYPWLSRQREHSERYWGGSAQEVMRETLKTDAEGRAHFTLPTDAASGSNWQYAIEARVTDESRREVAGRTSVRVTREPYFVYLQPRRQLYRPGETAEVTIKTLDANDQSVAVEGRVRLTRETWMEVWRGPDGEEISGQEFRRRQQSTGLFSRALDPAEWRKIREGYDVEELRATTLTTNAEGEAVFTFPVEAKGYYRVAWVSRPPRCAPIKRDTAVWVAADATQSIGFHGPLQIVADESAFREGERAPVMLTTPEPGRWVLFNVQGGGLIETRVVHLEGNVKLLNLEVTSVWVPNVQLHANATDGSRLHADMETIAVPPVKHFLDVRVEASAENFLPRESGTFTVTTRNHEGRPVAAEVALSIFDEAVLAIQPTLVPDPREFFYGEQRHPGVGSASSYDFRALVNLSSVNEQAANSFVLNKSGFASGDLVVASAGARSGHARSKAVAPFTAPSAKRMMLAEASTMDYDGFAADAAAAPSPGDEPAVVVRSDFRATAYWNPAIQTGDDGQAEVTVTFPDSLTTWQAEARATGLPASFGQGTSAVRTRLPLIARLQSPRFFVTGDTVTLSGVLTNNTDADLAARVELMIEGGLALDNSAPQSVDVPALGSARVDWTAHVRTPGEAKLTLTARSPEHADAMERTLPVFEHGIDKFLATSGKMSVDELAIPFEVPEFKPEGARFDLYLSPSIATTMLDALPYLARYPYGCTEQTMSRFLPAVIVARTLEDLGVSPSEVMADSFGGIESSTPTKVVEPHRREGDHGDLGQLDDMVVAGVQRLADFQHADGGWGWWKEGDSDPYMSAYVVWGLTLAQQAGRDTSAIKLDRARDYLAKELVTFEEQYDMQAWLLHALAVAMRGEPEPKPGKHEARAFANLWKNRDQLNAFTRALTALSAHWLGFEEEAKIVAGNLANGVQVDDDPQRSTLVDDSDSQNDSAMQSEAPPLRTAHWGDDGIAWRWSRGGVEATAFCLMALTEITPESEWIEPAMNWLVKNRRGAQWSNTRDTAMVVLALNAWLRQSGELRASGDYEAFVNGESVGTISVTPETVLSAPRVIEVPLARLDTGANEITLRRKAGESPLYYSARISFFSRENPVAAAGNEVFVRREYQRTYPVKTLLDGYATRAEPLVSGGTVDSGDRVEAIVTLEAKNDLEYLLVEDLKPAGFEAVALQSGAPLYARELRPGATALDDRYTGRTRWIYQELRDRQIATFASRLPQGLWEIRYELRAETPGTFSALPVIAEAMYVPEIKGNSAECKVVVKDRQE